MDEAIPLLLGKIKAAFLSFYILGSVILVFAVKLLFTQNNPPQNNHRLRESQEVGFEVREHEIIIRDLSAAFPDIPLPIIRDQLDRNRGDIEITTDALLQIAPRYLEKRTSVKKSEPKNTKEDIKKEEENEIIIDKKRWEQDKQFRSTLMKQRKQSMLKEAQRKFLEKTQRE
jgi:hypothetical protein